nr:response regulator [Bacilli bacterium]
MCRENEIVELLTKANHLTVLLVDDQKETLDLLALQLHSLPGIQQIWKATTSHDAIRTLQANPIDITVIVHEFCEESGFELCREIQDMQHDTEVVVCSIQNDAICKKKAFSLGVKQFIEKPIATEDLRHMIFDYLQRHQVTL